MGKMLLKRSFKKLIILCIGILCSLLLLEGSLRLVPFFISRSAKTKITNEHKDKVVFCMGDSYTLGFGLPYDRSYPAILNDLLSNSGYRVENLGVATANTSMLLRLLEEKLDKGDIPDIITLQAGEANIWNNRDRKETSGIRILRFIRLIREYIEQKNNREDEKPSHNNKDVEQQMESGETKKSAEEEFYLYLKKDLQDTVFFKDEYLKKMTSSEFDEKNIQLSTLREIYFGNLFTDISSIDLPGEDRNLIEGLRLSLHGDLDEALKRFLMVLKSGKKVYKVMRTIPIDSNFSERYIDEIQKELSDKRFKLRQQDKKIIFSRMSRPFDVSYVRAYAYEIIKSTFNTKEEHNEIIDSFYLFSDIISRFKPLTTRQFDYVKKGFDHFNKNHDLFDVDLFRLMVYQLKGFREADRISDYVYISKVLYNMYDTDESLRSKLEAPVKSIFMYERFYNTKDTEFLRKSLLFNGADKNTSFPYYLYELMNNTEDAFIACDILVKYSKTITDEQKKEISSIIFEAAYRKWHEYESDKALYMIDAAVDIIKETNFYWDLGWYTLHKSYIIEQLPDKTPDYDTPAKWFLRSYEDKINIQASQDNMMSLYNKGLKDPKLIERIKNIINIKKENTSGKSEFEPVRSWLEEDYQKFFRICDEYSIRFIGVGYAHTKNNILKEECEKNGYQFIELFNIFSDLVKKEGRKKYFLGDGHFSYEGNRVVANIIRERVFK